MTLLMEKPDLDAYETELAATPVPETPADLLPPAASSAPEVGLATDDYFVVPPLKAGGVVYVMPLDASGKPAPSGLGELSWADEIALTESLTSAAWKAIRERMYPGTAITNLEIADILDGAADRIDKAGWAQHALYEGSRSCVQGAIQFKVLGRHGGGFLGALHGYRESQLFQICNSELLQWLWGNRALTGCDRRWGTAEWNDQPGRTKEQVTTALRGAAKQARARA